MQWIRLARREAFRVASRFPPRFSEDIVSAGMIGLMEACAEEAAVLPLPFLISRRVRKAAEREAYRSVRFSDRHFQPPEDAFQPSTHSAPGVNPVKIVQALNMKELRRLNRSTVQHDRILRRRIEEVARA